MKYFKCLKAIFKKNMLGEYYTVVYSVSTATWEVTRKTFLSPDTLHINTQKVHVGQNLKIILK